MIKIKPGIIVAVTALVWGSTLGIIIRHLVTRTQMTPNQRSIFEELLAVGIVAAFALISVWAVHTRRTEEVDADTTRMLIEVGRIIERREAHRTMQDDRRESTSHIHAV